MHLLDDISTLIYMLNCKHICTVVKTSSVAVPSAVGVSLETMQCYDDKHRLETIPAVAVTAGNNMEVKVITGS